MEVMVVPAMDFEFNCAGSSPYLDSPSTPKRFGEFVLSAPTSPTRMSQLYREFDDFCLASNASPPPLKGRSASYEEEEEEDFAFHVSDELKKTTLPVPAEDLFHDGQIRPSKPPLHQASKKSSLSPRKKKKEADPFVFEKMPQRGRERAPPLSSSGSGRRAARSVSPNRVSKCIWEEEEQEQEQEQRLKKNTKQFSATTTSNLPCSSSKSGYKKWRLMDFFLFRSASEGRAADKDPLKKYTSWFRRHGEIKPSSFRSAEGSNSGSNSSSRRGPVSAHELHYTVNRAVSEDLKKKTFLPYKQGILGRLAFNPAVHALANGFGFSRK